MDEHEFFEVSEDRAGHMLVLIIYDICDNRKRVKFVKYLEGFGHRVQKSAFEARLSTAQYNRLLDGIPKFCAEEDSIRVYKIIGYSQVTSWGTEEIPEEEDIILI